MSFTQIVFLFGALAVVAPVIAHLLAKPRFRRLPFTMLRFLRTSRTEIQSRRRLRDILILLLRCAIIVLIAMLFARPRLLTEPKAEKVAPVYFLGLDNSMSMAYFDGSESYFDKLVASAADYIRTADDKGAFNMYSLASSEWARNLSKEQALAEVQRLRIVPQGARIGDFISELTGARRREHLDKNVSVLILSDFTPNTLGQFVEAEGPVPVDAIDCRPIVSPRPLNNAAVVDAHVGGIVDGKLSVNVTVINYGDLEQNRLLTARAGENVSEPVEVNLLANQRRNYPVQVVLDASGDGELSLPIELNLSGGDGLKEDDTFYMAVSVPRLERTNVLLVGGG